MACVAELVEGAVVDFYFRIFEILARVNTAVMKKLQQHFVQVQRIQGYKTNVCETLLFKLSVQLWKCTVL